ncbi:MAG: branched-chain amino acid ABC transporter permease [Clostridia bacterium]|nr:branched-chain amino acid ABC transporter permease [Clostridia bacterium]
MSQKLASFFKNPFWRRYGNYLAVLAVAVVFGALSISGVATSATQYLLEKIAIAVILAVSLCMVVGFLGELSLGHAGFMCVGAYAGGKIASLLVEAMGGNQNNILVLLLSLLVGGIVAALFGFIIGLPALRLRGDYLAIVTLAFGEIVRSVVMNVPATLFGGTLGLETPRFNKKYLFIFALVMVIACLAVAQNLMRSKHGRAIVSIKDNEIAARATGIDVTKYKLFVFTVSSFFAGIAGVLYSYSNYRLQSANFDYNYSIEILVMVVLGGMGSINGSMIAAALITFLNIKLQTTLTGNLAVLQNFFYAIILIIIVIYKNAPGLKTFREKYNMNVLWSKLKAKLQKQPDTTNADAKEGAENE